MDDMAKALQVAALNAVIDSVLRQAGLRPGQLWVERKPDGRLYICDPRMAGPLTDEEATPEAIERLALEWASVVSED
jgi:hypothetical protein